MSQAGEGAGPFDRIVVAMSGGVDSSVAAAMILEQGHQAIGVTMQLYGGGSRCCSLEDAEDARRVAERLGIRFYVAHYADAFRTEVIEPFADAYLSGRTPIPCIPCNTRFKFAHLLDRAEAYGACAVATGHYARIESDPLTGERRLFRARHHEKDQSYFLFQLSQAQLAAARFPLGDLSKEEVRERARKLGLATADKPESQEICFVPSGRYSDVVERIRPAAAGREGDIVDESGRVLGRHAGVHRFTVGQRHGLGVSAERPLYVLRLDPPNRRVVVGPRERLGQTRARVRDVHWIAGRPPDGPVEARVKIRYRHPGSVARVEARSESEAEVVFERPEDAITPGQAAVFYDAASGDEVLGGGFIEAGAR